MLSKIRAQNKGSITIEAVIVFSTVFFCLLAVMYLCLILYQLSYVQSIADKAAQRGSYIWNNTSKDMFIAKVKPENLRDTSLYWRIADGQVDVKKEKIKKYTQIQINAYSVLGIADKENISIDAKITEDYIIYKKMRVTVTSQYPNPVGSMLKNFGLEDKFVIRAHSDAIINEPTEFIRNTDFAIDTGKEIDRVLLNGKGASFLGDLSGTISKLMGKLKDFLDK